MPFAVILGDDEQARGEVRVKELGLEAGHAEKDGVLVPLIDLVSEVQSRIAQRLEGKNEAGDGKRRGEEGDGVEAVRIGLDGLGKAEEEDPKTEKHPL